MNNNKVIENINCTGNPLAVQWSGLCCLTPEVLGSVPGGEIKILQAAWFGSKNTKKTKKQLHTVLALWRWQVG